MNNTILIVSELPEKTVEYQKLLADSAYDVATFSPTSPISSETVEQLFLILVPEYDAHSTPSLIDLDIPLYIPVLTIGKQSSPPLPLIREHSTRLIDYLGGQPDRPALEARVAFLKKVAKLGYEHHGYLKNHDAFLDWITSRDGLTGLYNRHHFNKTLDSSFLTAQENNSELSLLFIDIDFFSDINKSCGQSFGDFVVNELSARLTATTRRNDLCFRLSGGDFVVLMPESDLLTARHSAQEILACSESKPFLRNTVERTVTLSIGLASYCTHRPSTVDQFVTMAETALFKAKAEGRNRLHIFAPRESTNDSSLYNDFDIIKLTINRILEKNKYSAISSLQLLARDIAGPTHREHIQRVSDYTELICKQLGFSQSITQTLQNAVTLYTSIRFLVHNNLLAKPAKFSQHDLETLRDFPYKLTEISELFDYFSQERLILVTRSEKFDGSGYPEGLKGDEIPLGARIINIVDSFAAMAADRPHRPKLSPGNILEELKKEAGKQFDPFLVHKLLDIIENNQLLEISTSEVAKVRTELLTTQPKQKT